jgi:hypothetical protein
MRRLQGPIHGPNSVDFACFSYIFHMYRPMGDSHPHLGFPECSLNKSLFIYLSFELGFMVAQLL